MGKFAIAIPGITDAPTSYGVVLLFSPELGLAWFE
jgi:hypothetical protein